ncbi:Zinc finger CCCH domain-containing protein 2 [Sesamum alatum]|uniref:Zinc finger CCCH domain-containing protein 2 n=1 Tax=Sesamum alatum TaxID=300844 RepID=A0AAE1YYP7_9LAMI|nr:Zinc finger CCCH domain-containing protein 2 [Sesamum alatum]
MMGSVCAEQQHKFHHSHQLYLTKKSLREIDIPPRKLLSRRSSGSSASPADISFMMDSPKAEDAVFSKFLPCNNLDDDDSDPYSSDHFRMYEFKVRKCNRSRSHDWTDCPFAHPGEKARRRDPRRYHYSGTVCSEFRKGHCSKGDNCEFSHGVFECWLHPTRYRTEACKDGKNCKRKVCFFAHSTRQLRILPETSPPHSPRMNSPTTMEKKYRNLNHCCLFCHSMTASPTSTLMGNMSHASPPLSPPISPVCSSEFSPYADRYSGVEAYGDRFGSHESCCRLPELSVGGGGMSYKDALTELMASFEAMNVNHEAVSSPAAVSNVNLPWLDVNFNVEEQPQFLLSPSTPTPTVTAASRGHGKFFHGEFSGRNLMDDSRYNCESNLAGPDFGWVNDLLT